MRRTYTRSQRPAPQLTTPGASSATDPARPLGPVYLSSTRSAITTTTSVNNPTRISSEIYQPRPTNTTHENPAMAQESSATIISQLNQHHSRNTSRYADLSRVPVGGRPMVLETPHLGRVQPAKAVENPWGAQQEERFPGTWRPQETVMGTGLDMGMATAPNVPRNRTFRTVRSNYPFLSSAEHTVNGNVPRSSAESVYKHPPPYPMYPRYQDGYNYSNRCRLNPYSGMENVGYPHQMPNSQGGFESPPDPPSYMNQVGQYQPADPEMSQMDDYQDACRPYDWRFPQYRSFYSRQDNIDRPSRRRMAVDHRRRQQQYMGPEGWVSTLEYLMPETPMCQHQPTAGGDIAGYQQGNLVRYQEPPSNQHHRQEDHGLGYYSLSVQPRAPARDLPPAGYPPAPADSMSVLPQYLTYPSLCGQQDSLRQYSAPAGSIATQRNSLANWQDELSRQTIATNPQDNKLISWCINLISPPAQVVTLPEPAQQRVVVPSLPADGGALGGDPPDPRLLQAALLAAQPPQLQAQLPASSPHDNEHKQIISAPQVSSTMIPEECNPSPSSTPDLIIDVDGEP